MQNPPNPRKRILDPTAPLINPRSRLRRRTSTQLLPASLHPGECGRLITVDVKRGLLCECVERSHEEGELTLTLLGRYYKRLWS